MPTFGRTSELRALERLSSSHSTLVVVGPAGVGKTTLVETGAPADAVFVDLRPVHTIDGLLDKLVERLSLSGGELATVIQQTRRELEDRASWLVLDNVEQIPEVESVISPLANDAYRIIVTSRRMLDLPEAGVMPLRPLELEAGCELYEHAYGGNAPRDEIRRLVRKLDSLPLAIELAAGWEDLMGPGAFVERLDSEALALLDGDDGGVRAALSLSVQLLNDRERLALARASVFRGGFDLEAAEDVLLADPAASRVALRRLVSTSLVQVRDTPLGKRFELLETVRLFADELESHQPEADAAIRHAAHFGPRARELQRRFDTPDHGLAIDEMITERDNFLAVLERRERLPPDEVIACLLVLAPWFMSLHGPVSRYSQMMDSHREIVDQASTAIRAEFENQRGLVAFYVGDFAGAQARHEVAERLLRPQGPSSRLSLAARGRGMALVYQGETQEARSCFEEAREIAGAIEDDLAEGRAVVALGNLAIAIREWEEALAHYDRAGVLLEDSAGVAIRGTLEANRALVLHRNDDLERAAAGFERALEFQVAAGEHRSSIETICLWAESLVRLGDYDRAEELVEQATATSDDLGWDILFSHIQLLRGQILLGRGEIPGALEVLTRATALAREIGDAGVLRRAFLNIALAELDRDRTTQAHGAARNANAVESELEAPRLLDCCALLVRLLSGAPLDEPVSDDLVVGRFRSLCKAWREPPGGDDILAETRADHVHFESRFFRQIVADRVSSPRVEVAPQARAVTLEDGTQIDLSRRQAMRRVFWAMARARVESPGDSLDVYELFTAGWPGEEPDVELATNRVYNSLYVLRKLGFDELILKLGDGYLLDPDVEVVLAIE